MAKITKDQLRRIRAYHSFTNDSKKRNPGGVPMKPSFPSGISNLDRRFIKPEIVNMANDSNIQGVKAKTDYSKYISKYLIQDWYNRSLMFSESKTEK